MAKDDWKAKGRRHPLGGRDVGDQLVVPLASLTPEELGNVIIVATPSWTSTAGEIDEWLKSIPSIRGGDEGDLAVLERHTASIWELRWQVHHMVNAGNASLAAHYGVELGMIMSKCNFQLGFGKDIDAGNRARERAEASRADPAEKRIAAFNQYRSNGKNITASYKYAGRDLGCSAGSVKRDVLAHNKKVGQQTA